MGRAGLVAVVVAPRGFTMDEFTLARAKRSPSSVFDTPEAIRDHPDLEPAQKIELLRRWAYDAAELQVAEEEGMGHGERADMVEVLRVLSELGADLDPDHPAPTKQGGI